MKFSEEEYERLLVENQERIYRLALRIIGNREEALDVTQETLAAAYQQREKFRGEAKISTYLYRIGLNYAFASLKKRKRQHLPIDSIGERPGNLDSPAQALAKKERARRMELLLDGLPARQKAAVHLRIYEDLPFAEVARILGCQPATARTLFFFGLKNLRRIIKEKDPAGALFKQS